MSTFVLIHGGGHGGWCYAKVKARLEAATPRNGQSLVDHAGPTLELARPAGTTVDGMELVLLPSAEAGLFYGVTDPEDLAWMADRLTPQPWACFAQKLLLTNEDALSKSRSSTSYVSPPCCPAIRTSSSPLEPRDGSGPSTPATTS